jgi:hypothetical protein
LVRLQVSMGRATNRSEPWGWQSVTAVILGAAALVVGAAVCLGIKSATTELKRAKQAQLAAAARKAVERAMFRGLLFFSCLGEGRGGMARGSGDEERTAGVKRRRRRIDGRDGTGRRTAESRSAE